jgi:hypothetical protein
MATRGLALLAGEATPTSTGDALGSVRAGPPTLCPVDRPTTPLRERAPEARLSGRTRRSSPCAPLRPFLSRPAIPA